MEAQPHGQVLVGAVQEQRLRRHQARTVHGTGRRGVCLAPDQDSVRRGCVGRDRLVSPAHDTGPWKEEERTGGNRENREQVAVPCFTPLGSVLSVSSCSLLSDQTKLVQCLLYSLCTGST